MDADADADSENQYIPPTLTPFSNSPLVELPSVRRVSTRAAINIDVSGNNNNNSNNNNSNNSPNAETIIAVPVQQHLTRKKFLCFHRNINRIDELINIILMLPTLSPLEKTTLRIRYIELLISFNHRCTYYSLLFKCLRIIVTVGSLLVPALLSVQYDDKYKTDMYWATWVISLAVTTSNGIFTLFKIDKKYYFLHTIRDLLISEGWQYIALTGRYGTGGHLPLEGGRRTHSVLFPFFCHYIEKIKLKQVEEEYYKGIESNQTQGYAAAAAPGAAATAASTQTQTAQTQAAQTAPTQTGNKLYQITPDKTIEEAKRNVEPTTKVQVNQFLNTMAAQQQQQSRSPSPPASAK